MRRIVYDGESFYELDEECVRKREEKERLKESGWQRNEKGGNAMEKESTKSE